MVNIVLICLFHILLFYFSPCSLAAAESSSSMRRRRWPAGTRTRQSGQSSPPVHHTFTMGPNQKVRHDFKLALTSAACLHKDRWRRWTQSRSRSWSSNWGGESRLDLVQRHVERMGSLTVFWQKAAKKVHYLKTLLSANFGGKCWIWFCSPHTCKCFLSRHCPLSLDGKPILQCRRDSQFHSPS